MKTARLQVLTTPAFRDWLRKEARKEGVSVGELVRTRCQQKTATGKTEEKALGELFGQLREAVDRARSSLREGLAEAEQTLRELRENREKRMARGA
jgi:hypothetical protein